MQVVLLLLLVVARGETPTDAEIETMYQLLVVIEICVKMRGFCLFFWEKRH